MLVAVPFTGRARDVLLGFKYRNRRAVAGHLAGLLVNRLARSGQRVDVVTWAPTSRRRRGARGFDQAELVARHVARQLGVPCRRLLERPAGGRPQTGLGRAARLARAGVPGPSAGAGRRACWSSTTWSRPAPRSAAAATALRRAGAADVVLAAVAATPAGRSRRVQQVA